MAAPRLKLKLFTTATLALAGGLFWLFAAWFAVPVLPSLGQFTPSVSMQFVTVNPSGACKANVPLRYNRVNGNLWGCDSLVWTLVGGTTASSVFSSGVSLAGASFPRASVSAAGMGDVDIFPAPTSPAKRVLVTVIGGLNAGGMSVTWYAELKVGSTYYRLQSPTTTLSGANAVASFVGIVLEPGETLSVNTTAAGMNFSAAVVQFDSTSPLSTAKLLGPSTGNNTLYTASGKTAFITGTGGIIWNSPSGTFLAAGATPATVNTCLIPSGGGATCTANSTGQYGTASMGANVRSQITSTGISMNSGDMLVANVSAGDAAQIIWVNKVEISN